jgi:hypothetical protein
VGLIKSFVRVISFTKGFASFRGFASLISFIQRVIANKRSFVISFVISFEISLVLSFLNFLSFVEHFASVKKRLERSLKGKNLA